MYKCLFISFFFVISFFLIGACGQKIQNSKQISSNISDPNSSGKEIFENNCVKCHHYGGGGKGPNLSKKKLTPERIRKQVRKGGLIMPKFPESVIDEQSLDKLVDFVLSLNPENK